MKENKNNKIADALLLILVCLWVNAVLFTLGICDPPANVAEIVPHLSEDPTLLEGLNFMFYYMAFWSFQLGVHFS